MEEKLCFVAVEFVDDQNVVGWTYWYVCPYGGAEEGDEVIAPLGRHNNVQKGLIRKVLYATAQEAPYPTNSIKKVKLLIKAQKDV